MNLKVIIVGIALLLFVAWVTKPGEEAHRALIEREVQDYIETTLSKEMGEDNSLGSLFAKSMVAMFSTTIIEQISQRGIEIDDYLFFNRSYLSIDGQRIPIATGIFGNTIVNSSLEQDLDDFVDSLGKTKSED